MLVIYVLLILMDPSRLIMTSEPTLPRKKKRNNPLVERIIPLISRAMSIKVIAPYCILNVTSEVLLLKFANPSPISKNLKSRVSISQKISEKLQFCTNSLNSRVRLLNSRNLLNVLMILISISLNNTASTSISDPMKKNKNFSIKSIPMKNIPNLIIRPLLMKMKMQLNSFNTKIHLLPSLLKKSRSKKILERPNN